MNCAARAAAPSIVAGLLLLSLAVSPATAQQASTCGWHFLDAQPAPPTLVRLLDRTETLTPRYQEAVDNLLRWYTTCDHTAARRAQMSLRREQSRTNSTDPFLLGLMGLTYVRGPDVHVLRGEGAIHRPINRHTNAEIAGMDMLASAVAATGWPELVHEIAAAAVTTRKSESLKIAAEALRQIPPAMRDREYHIALAEVEVTRGNLDVAIDALEKGAAHNPRVARLLGIARMLNDDDPAAGADIYLGGLAAAETPSDIQSYFDDLRVLLSDGERADWDKLTGEHTAWIRRKWEWRAMLSGIRIHDRLAVHHNRLDEALRRFRRTSYRGSEPRTAALPEESLDIALFDDRGIIFLRHGEPQRELRMARAEGGRREVNRIAWIYSATGIEPVYEFDRTASHADYFLAEPYPLCGAQDLATGAPVARGLDSPSELPSNLGYPVAGDMADWGNRIHRHDPALGKHYQRCSQGPEFTELNFPHIRAEARLRGAALVNSENAVPRFARPLTAAMNLYSFGARGGATELVAYLAVGAGGLTPASNEPPLAYAFRILLAAGDPVTESIARTDTVIAFSSPTPLPDDATAGTAVTLRVPPTDNARVTMSVVNGHDGAQGQVLAVSRTIPSVSTTALALSDIVIGEPRDGAWRRGTYRLAPARGHAVATGTAFRIYSELYNARRDDPLAIEIVIAPGRDPSLLGRLSELISSRNALAVRFEEGAVPDEDGVLRMEREILNQLEAGAYVVTISVRNTRTDEAARSETNLIVVD